MLDDWEIRWLNPYWIYSKSRIGTELNKHGEEVSYGTNWFDTKEEAEQAIKLWREKNMNYMMINGKRIEISEETAKNLEKEFSPKTYKVGDKFQSTLCKDIGLLISGGNKVGMLDVKCSCVYSGFDHDGGFKAVKDRNKITEDELIMIAGRGWELIED